MNNSKQSIEHLEQQTQTEEYSSLIPNDDTQQQQLTVIIILFRMSNFSLSLSRRNNLLK